LIKYQVGGSTPEIWEKSLAFWLPRLYYSINVAILFKEHVIFWTSSLKYVLTPNRDIKVKFPFHNLGSAS